MPIFLNLDSLPTSYLCPQSPSDLFILPDLLSFPTVTFRPLSFLRDSHQSSLLKWPHSCLIYMLILQRLGQLDLFVLPLINWVELLYSTQFWHKLKDLRLLSALRSIGVAWQVYISILEGSKTLSPPLIFAHSHLQTSLFFQTSYLCPQSPSELFLSSEIHIKVHY